MVLMDYRRLMGVHSLPRGEGVRIAILDSGVPPPHVLGRKLSEIPPEDCAEDPDECGHATAISSILIGGGPIQGLCEYSSPIFVKVLDAKGRGSVKTVVNGIYKAIDRSADVINLSLGFVRTEKCPPELEIACQTAYDMGKTVICAAGNDGGAVNWPAALETTICVGSTDKNGTKNAFSSVGEVDFVAPGVDLPVLDLKGNLKEVSGTSFATALVTGVVALLVSRMRSSGIAYVGMDQVVEVLQGFSRDVDAPGWDENTGYGLIDGKCVDPVNLKMKNGLFGIIWERIISFFKQKRS